MSETELRELSGWLYDLARNGKARSLNDITLALKLSQATIIQADIRSLLFFLRRHAS